MSPEEVAEINSSNKVLDEKCKIVTSIGEDSYVLDLDGVNSKLKGKFIWTEKDEVVYYDKNLGKLPEVGEGDGGSDELPE